MAFDPITGEEIDDVTGLPSVVPTGSPTPPPQAAPEPPAAMNPTVKDYILQKFNLGDYSDENRKKLEAQAQPTFGDRATAALAAIGAGFQGQDAGAAGARSLDAAKSERRQKLQDFDKGRANAIQEKGLNRQATVEGREDQQYQQQQDLQARERDANSDESKIAQQAAAKMGYKGDVSKLTAEQFKTFSPAMEKIYQVEQAAQVRRDAINAKAAEAAAKRNEGVTAGRKSLDQDFAKDYNDWTSGGQAALDKNLERLRGARAKLDERKNDLFGTSGRFTGNLPDNLRSEESKQIRQDVQAAAQGALKATLGSQFTEKEGERIMKAAYDETLSPQANIDKIDAAIKELETSKNNKNAKSQHFERTGTLTGFKNPSESSGLQTAGNGMAGTAGLVERKDKATGKIALFDPTTKKFIRYKE